jgi:hypothetical protein
VVRVEGGELVGEGDGTRHLAVAETAGMSQLLPNWAMAVRLMCPASVAARARGDERHGRGGAAFRLSGVGQLGEASKRDGTFIRGLRV